MIRSAVSAGCVVTRQGRAGVEVLLVHPRRASFRLPLFGIPKGAVDPGETLEQAACRETLEETGLRVRLLGSLGSVRQKSGKVVHAFHAEVDDDSLGGIDALGRCDSPDGENDVCRFYTLDKALQLMLPAQRPLLERLREKLAPGLDKVMGPQ